MADLRHPEVLNREHDRSQFSCGEPTLDEWLQRYAGQNRRGNTAATWVIADADHRVAAYASLSMTAIDHIVAPARLRKDSPDPVPALLIGRLAVDTAFAGLGVGSAMVAHLAATAIELNLRAACRALVVTALHDSARRWWLHLGFQPFDEESSLDLFLLTADLQKTFDAGKPR